MKHLQNKPIHFFRLAILSLCIGLLGCNSNNHVETREPTLEFLPSLIGKDLPTSRYLSNQSQENLRPDGKERGGYDEAYRLLNYRRLERITAIKKGEPGYVDGLRPGAKVVLPPPFRGEDSNFSDMISGLLKHLTEPEAQFEQTKKAIDKARNDSLLKSPRQPRVVISGLGPTGLLAALEAYASGASVVAIEQRSLYTRPQILRLTNDTIDRLKYFMGGKFWEYLRRLGIVSTSPNWVPNKFDVNNFYLYPKGPVQFSADLIVAKDKYLARGLELFNVDIIRINHLESVLAIVLESLARADPQHLRIYYGAELLASLTGKGELKLEISSGSKKNQYPLAADILAIAQGVDSAVAKTFGFETKAISKPLYGATVALRLPKGFDIGLRPIENRDGTASVKGIALIDPEKLTLNGNYIESATTGKQYRWTMVLENELCHELNFELNRAIKELKFVGDAADILLPCDTLAKDLPPMWQKKNGGDKYFLPRTRYFFTGGIAYLGAELNEGQLKLLQKRANDPEAQKRQLALKRFMLVLAKKHMPKEYVEGQDHQAEFGPLINETLGQDLDAADKARVIIVTEENYSLTTFPILLRKAAEFMKFHNLSSRPLRVVLLGDSFATTHFFTGSGAVNGLRAASSFGQALKEGADEKAFLKAQNQISTATDEMHRKVTEGLGNAPLDGPFNEQL